LQKARTAYVGATLIDGTGAEPLPGSAVVVGDGRIEYVGRAADFTSGPELELVDLDGTFLIPGLLDANVHLVMHVDPAILFRYAIGEYDELAVEAAQVALKAGITTVFDTWGPLETLKRVRDRIASGDVLGSRLFCAGNIIGNSGPWGPDFLPAIGAPLPRTVVDAVNAHWTRGVGEELTWMSAADVRAAVREYVETSGIDFLKYAGSAHAHGRFLAFSPEAQQAIVEEAHRAGLTAQACTMTPEALKVAIDAGVDLLQHGDITGLRPMPQETLDTIVARQLPCVAFLTTERHVRAATEQAAMGEQWTKTILTKDANDRRLIEAGANLLLAYDGGLFHEMMESSPVFAPFLATPDPLYDLGHTHLTWLTAAFERGMKPMDALLSTTRNIAEAYGQDDELGTVEVGKIADLVVLEADPLASADAYGRVAHVVKDGAIVDRGALPERPVLTAA
jgi:imidazolonepropionase-like amidohydrolase